MRKNILIILSLTFSLTAMSQRMDDKAEHSEYIQSVDEYMPAPGQYVNVLPEYEDGDDTAAILKKCTECLAENAKTMITLGSYGGYVTFHFDHSIVNVKGENDVRILGNCSYDGNSEPGIVMVSRDENGNGLPDDTWYELKGSADKDSIGKVVFGYERTYKRPVSEEPDGKVSTMSKYITREEYAPWTDNKGGSGYVYKNSYHTQSYYPLWIAADELNFGPATLLPKNATNILVYPNEQWIREAYAWGYVDNKNEKDPANGNFNFDNAVEVVSREPVDIQFVDFIRVYCGVSQNCGWIGETSTEVTTAEDLHKDTSIKKIKEALSGITAVTTADSRQPLYDLQGRRVQSPSGGLYIRNGKKFFIK